MMVIRFFASVWPRPGIMPTHMAGRWVVVSLMGWGWRFTGLACVLPSGGQGGGSLVIVVDWGGRFMGLAYVFPDVFMYRVGGALWGCASSVGGGCAWVGGRVGGGA